MRNGGRSLLVPGRCESCCRFLLRKLDCESALCRFIFLVRRGPVSCCRGTDTRRRHGHKSTVARTHAHGASSFAIQAQKVVTKSTELATRHTSTGAVLRARERAKPCRRLSSAVQYYLCRVRIYCHSALADVVQWMQPAESIVYSRECGHAHILIIQRSRKSCFYF